MVLEGHGEKVIRKKPKAILLLSGGLDSTLAGKMLLTMGVEVEALHFVSPFCRCTPKSLGCSAAGKSAEQLGIRVRVIVCGCDYLEVIKHPRFGRGCGMNACLDCRIFKFSIPNIPRVSEICWSTNRTAVLMTYVCFNSVDISVFPTVSRWWWAGTKEKTRPSKGPRGRMISSFHPKGCRAPTFFADRPSKQRILRLPQSSLRLTQDPVQGST